ncbi:MAG: hypothetical protein H0T56_05705 [Pseudaminobacter sp.]|nr:hypothetical protein [Pseudaminobacter sp.]
MAHDEDGEEFRVVGGRKLIRPSYSEYPILGGGRGSAATLQSPLFSGRLQVSDGTSNDAALLQSSRVKKITADLRINPTRYVHHQPITRYGVSEPEDMDLGSRRMRRSTSRFVSGSESLLVLDDNLVIGSQRRLHMSSPRLWPRHLERYCSGVVDTLVEVVEATADACFCASAFRPFARVDSIETYWEFFQPNPVTFIGNLEQPLWAIAGESDRRGYSFRVRSTGVLANSPRLSIDIAKGVDLKIYAKTDERMRFEIRHVLKHRPSVVQPGRSFTDLDLLPTAVTSVAVDAAAKLNEVFAQLALLASPVAGGRTILELVREVNAASAHQSEATAILDILVTTGRIGLITNDPKRDAVRRLARKGVLMHLSRSGRVELYHVGAEFRGPLQRLRAANSHPLLPMR